MSERGRGGGSRDFRDSSKRAATDFLAQAAAEFRQVVSDSVASVQETAEHVRRYIRSDEFERDLDRLATRLQVDRKPGYVYPVDLEDRDSRVRAKAQFIAEHARDEILKAAEVGGAFGLLFRKSRAMAIIALIAGGVRAGSIGYELIRIFAPARRRGGLRVVE